MQGLVLCRAMLPEATTVVPLPRSQAKQAQCRSGSLLGDATLNSMTLIEEDMDSVLSAVRSE
jgi:hypothetical protein